MSPSHTPPSCSQLLRQSGPIAWLVSSARHPPSASKSTVDAVPANPHRAAINQLTCSTPTRSTENVSPASTNWARSTIGSTVDALSALLTRQEMNSPTATALMPLSATATNSSSSALPRSAPGPERPLPGRADQDEHGGLEHDDHREHTDLRAQVRGERDPEVLLAAQDRPLLHHLASGVRRARVDRPQHQRHQHVAGARLGHVAIEGVRGRDRQDHAGDDRRLQPDREQGSAIGEQEGGVPAGEDAEVAEERRAVDRCCMTWSAIAEDRLRRPVERAERSGDRALHEPLTQLAGRWVLLGHREGVRQVARRGWRPLGRPDRGRSSRPRVRGRGPGRTGGGSRSSASPPAPCARRRPWRAVAAATSDAARCQGRDRTSAHRG